MLAVAVASFKETLRKRIFIIVGILTVIYFILFGLIVHYSVKDMAGWNFGDSMGIYIMVSQIVSVLGFYFSSMLVAFLTIMSSVGTVSSEIESGIIHSIITRPIKRMEYIIGKYIGLAILVAVYSIILYSGVFLICYIMKLPVINTIGIMQFLKGLFFFTLQPMAILSLSIWGSARFKTLTNGIIVIAVYILGLIGSMMEQIGTVIQNEHLVNWGIVSSLLSPFDVIYRKLISSVFPALGTTNLLLEFNKMSGTSPSKWMMIYIFIYMLGLFILTVRKFEKKDIG